MRANPVPESEPHVLGERARSDLAALLGDPQPAGPAPAAAAPPPHRSRPRRGAVLVVASVAAVVLAGVAVTTLLGRTAPPPMSDEPYYGTTAELEGAADLIVRGTLGAERTTTAQGFEETVADVLVSSVGRGDAGVGDTVEIAYTTPGSGPETADGLVDGGEYVLLLVTDPDGGPAHLVSSVQGYYVVEDDGTLTSEPANDVTLSPGLLAALGL